MKKILLALSVAFCSAQLNAQLPVYWQTATPASFSISGSMIRNTAWASNMNYANSLQRLPQNRDGYIEFSAETPVTAGVYYQVGFAKASSPGTPVVAFQIKAGTTAAYCYPSIYDASGSATHPTFYTPGGSCTVIPTGTVLRLERTGNTVRFWNKTGNCELIYSTGTITLPAATEDWVVVFKGTGDGVVSGAVNTKVSFSGTSDELWGRVSPTALSPVLLTDMVGIGRDPSYFLDVAGSIRAVSTIHTSDKRFKENVKDIDRPMDMLRRLSGKMYTFKTKDFPGWNFDEGLQYGFIAQELKKVMPELVKEDREGFLGVNYTMLIPVMTEAIKTQQQEIELLQQELALLKSNQLPQTISGTTGIIVTDAYLAQNVPNPFSQTTSINYKLPAGISAASLGIYDLIGKEIRLFHLERAATGSVTINGGDLKPGMYIYTLIIDGKYFDSKKMILTSE